MKSRTLFLAAVLSLCLGAVVSAQQTTVEGTVVSNSGGTLVLNTAEGTRTFLVDGQTSVPATLAAGTRVTIEYQTTSDNQMHAFKVTPAGPPPATTTDTTTADATGTASSTTAPAATTTAPAETTTAPAPAPATGSTMTDTTTTTTSPSTAATQPTTTPSTTATDTTTTAPMTADTSNERLPATASPLPLIALVGTLALAAGVALRLRHA